MSSGRRLRYWGDEIGTSAVEFALVLPAFAALTLGLLQICLLYFANSSLQYATQFAARCMSLQATVCSSQPTTSTYATSEYNGPTLSGLTFTASFKSAGARCGAGGVSGNKLTASGTYVVNAVLVTLTVPLSATSCFPA